MECHTSKSDFVFQYGINRLDFVMETLYLVCLICRNSVFNYFDEFYASGVNGVLWGPH
jgi:hypothetical protein